MEKPTIQQLQVERDRFLSNYDNLQVLKNETKPLIQQAVQLKKSWQIIPQNLKDMIKGNIAVMKALRNEMKLDHIRDRERLKFFGQAAYNALFSQPQLIK